MGSSENTVGLKLRALKDRTDLSLGQIGTLLGRPRSSIQRFFEPTYRPGGYLDINEALEFAQVFVGKGDPPIDADELLALTALPMVNEAMGARVPPLSEAVAMVMANAYCSLILRGREPVPGTEEALARMIRELSLLHQRDPAIRSDAVRTQGALQILALQLS